MAKVSDIFNGAEGGSLTLEQFQAKATELGAKFTDLSEGKYISLDKHNSEITAKDEQIGTLNDTLSERDKDLANLQTQLTNAGNDAEKLATVSADLASLQAKYDDDVKAFQSQIAKQARDFAIKEYAATKKFTSGAAKRDYIATMQNTESVKLDKSGVLKGLSDFDEDYSKENADAFVVEEDKQDPDPIAEQQAQFQNTSSLPMFAQHTGGESGKQDAKESFGFSFMPQQNTN